MHVGQGPGTPMQQRNACNVVASENQRFGKLENPLLLQIRRATDSLWERIGEHAKEENVIPENTPIDWHLWFYKGSTRSFLCHPHACTWRVSAFSRAALSDIFTWGQSTKARRRVVRSLHMKTIHLYIYIHVLYESVWCMTWKYLKHVPYDRPFSF